MIDLITFKQPIETKLLVDDESLHNNMYVYFWAFEVKPLMGTWELQSPDYHVLAKDMCEKFLLWVKGDIHEVKKLKK